MIIFPSHAHKKWQNKIIIASASVGGDFLTKGQLRPIAHQAHERMTYLAGLRMQVYVARAFFPLRLLKNVYVFVKYIYQKFLLLTNQAYLYCSLGNE